MEVAISARGGGVGYEAGDGAVGVGKAVATVGSAAQLFPAFVVGKGAGATIKSVAADLGVNTETLRNWIRAAEGRRPG
ncbi:transposase, partial [Streptomyces roseus]|uniref:transposase n=1 Tax=Streptomyces roseus TaxID=66430 RepID=UPI0038090526